MTVVTALISALFLIAADSDLPEPPDVTDAAAAAEAAGLIWSNCRIELRVEQFEGACSRWLTLHKEALTGTVAAAEYLNGLREIFGEDDEAALAALESLSSEWPARMDAIGLLAQTDAERTRNMKLLSAYMDASDLE